jgi:hypothetical protein
VTDLLSAKGSSLPAVPVSEPFTGADLARDLLAVREWGAAFWQTLVTEDFFAPVEGAWSPADPVRHLCKSNRPVARALELGLLTVREMLFFTLYHNTHHVLGVAQRRPGRGPVVPVGVANSAEHEP